MAKHEQANSESKLKASAEFIRQVLAKNFRQNVSDEDLRQAAEKLCEALPEKNKVAA